MEDKDKARTRICVYAARNHVLSLAASDGRDLWCASCFYAFDAERMSFIIMTETETRHGAMMLGHQRVSGTIAGQTRTVACIRGLQFRGTAHILDSAPTAERTMYCRRFPVARLSKAPIWRIDIDEGKMTDNTLGFGTKLVWTRPPTP